MDYASVPMGVIGVWTVVGRVGLGPLASVEFHHGHVVEVVGADLDKRIFLRVPPTPLSVVQRDAVFETMRHARRNRVHEWAEQFDVPETSVLAWNSSG